MTVSIRRFGAADIRAHQDEFVELLRDAVEGGSSVNFIAPMDLDLAAASWDKWAGEVAAGQRIVLAALDDERVIGCVHLVLAMSAQRPAPRRRAEGAGSQQRAAAGHRHAVDERD